MDDLAGKTVHVRKVSTYYLSLTALNEQFKKDGKPEIKIVLVPDALEDEDLLEMLDVGLLQTIVVDDWKAKAWKQVLPNVKLHEQIVLRPKTRMGWAIRKDSPKLAAELNEFYAWYVKQVGTAGTTLMRDYMKRVKAMRNAAAAEDQKRIRNTDRLLQEIRRPIQVRPPDARRAGLSGIAAQPERQERCRRDRHHAAHAGDGQRAQGRRHQAGRDQHPCRHEVHGHHL